VDTFAAFEHALKRVGFRWSPRAAVEADWDAYATSIQEPLTALNDQALLEAITFLVAAPPRRQIETPDGLTWETIPRPPALSEVVWLFRIVRQVRNNLVHGGKRSPNAPVEPGRDKRLVENALAVLVASAPLNAEVLAAYEDVAF
jgi:hypothetical protein